MTTITLSAILDDLRTADHALRQFEQRFWLSSDVFYDLYAQGLLDDGSYSEDFAEWAGHYKLKLKREAVLKTFSQRRVDQLRREIHGGTIELELQEPVLELTQGER